MTGSPDAVTRRAASWMDAVNRAEWAGDLTNPHPSSREALS